MAPCIFYLVIEYARPVAYAPMLGLLRLGMWASFWGFATLIITGGFRFTKPIRLLICFLALMSLHVAFARNNRLAFNAFWVMAILFLGSVIPIGVLPRSLSEVRILIVSYFALHLPTVIHGIIHNGTGLSGWILDENDLAFALLAALGVGLYVFFAVTRARDKLIVGLMLGLTLFCIIRTDSRGGFVGLVGEIAYVVVMGPQRKKIVAMLVIVGALALLFTPASYWKDMQSIETSTNHDDTGYQRLVSWAIAWEIYKDYPILGIGSMNYLVYAERYSDVVRSRMYVPRHFWGRAAHSLYFTLLAEQGTVGTIIFVLLLAWYFWASRRVRHWAATLDSEDERRWLSCLASGLDAGMIGALGSGTFLTVLYYPVIWTLIGLMTALELLVPRPTAVPRSASHNSAGLANPLSQRQGRV